MATLVQLKELKGQSNTAPTAPQTKEIAVPPMIAQLRNRLVSGASADSLDVKVAIVGELVWLCYQDLMKRRYL